MTYLPEDWRPYLMPASLALLAVTLLMVTYRLTARRHRQRAEDERRSAPWAVLVLLLFVALAAAQSYRGLHIFAVDLLGLSPVWAVMFPAMVDAAAMAFALTAIRGARDNVPTTGARTLVAGLVAGSVAMNWSQAAHRGDGLLGQLVSAGVALVAFGGFEVSLSQTRYRALRKVKAVRDPMPRFALLLWIRFPRLTFRAWSLALRHGISDIDEAMTEAEMPHLRLLAWLRFPLRAFRAKSALLAAEIDAVYPVVADAERLDEDAVFRARIAELETALTANVPALDDEPWDPNIVPIEGPNVPAPTAETSDPGTVNVQPERSTPASTPPTANVPTPKRRGKRGVNGRKKRQQRVPVEQRVAELGELRAAGEDVSRAALATRWGCTPQNAGRILAAADNHLPTP